MGWHRSYRWVLTSKTWLALGVPEMELPSDGLDVEHFYPCSQEKTGRCCGDLRSDALKKNTLFQKSHDTNHCNYLVKQLDEEEKHPLRGSKSDWSLANKRCFPVSPSYTSSISNLGEKWMNLGGYPSPPRWKTGMFPLVSWCFRPQTPETCSVGTKGWRIFTKKWATLGHVYV